MAFMTDNTEDQYNNPYSLANAANDQPKSKEETEAELRNAVAFAVRKRFQPQSKTTLPSNFKFKDAIARRLKGAGINASVYRVGNTKATATLLSNKNNLDSIDKFLPPYDPDYLARLQNAREFDPVIKQGLRLKTWFVLNDNANLKHRMTMRTMEEFETLEDEEAYFFGIFKDKTARNNLKRYVDNVCIDSNIFTQIPETYELSHVFGRAASLKIFPTKSGLEEKGWYKSEEENGRQYFEKTPLLFQPLSPMLMGNVTVDKSTWTPTWMYYNDSIFGEDPTEKRPKPAGWIKADQMIYITRQNIHLLPNKLNYGMSELTPILPVSELIRQLHSDILGEAIANLILPSLFLIFDGLDQAKMQEIIDNYQQGGIMGRNKNVEMQPIDFNVNLPAITELMKELRRIVFQSLEIPYFLGGDTEGLAYESAVAYIRVWNKTVLEPERDEIQRILDNQFYQPLVADYMEEFYPQDYKAWNTERIRFLLKFPTIDFENIWDKAAALGTLMDRFVFTQKQVRLMFNQPPYAPEQVEIMAKIEKFLAEHPDLQDQIMSALTTLTTPPQLQQVNANSPETIEQRPGIDPDQEINQDPANMIIQDRAVDQAKKLANNQF